jgi:putative transposase
VGFPRQEKEDRSKHRLRFTTGAMRFEEDRRGITLPPVIGTLRSKENTSRGERHVRKGSARILSITLSERWGRPFVAVQYAVRTRVVPRRRPWHDRTYAWGLTQADATLPRSSMATAEWCA